MSTFRDRLTRALELDLPYSERAPVQRGTPASVLMLFAPTVLSWELLVTRRTEHLEKHKGQMAFPGGMAETTDSDARATALRETEEEVGIPPRFVDVVGELPRLEIVTDFRVTPVVGLLTCARSEAPFRANEDEIAESIWVPLERLNDPGVYSLEHREYEGLRFPIHVYQIGPHRIWGATGAMIKNLLDRLQSLG